MALPNKPSHPVYDLGVKKPEPKTQAPPPTIETLQALAASGNKDVVMMMIEQFKLPLKLDPESGLVIDALAGTELYLSKFITCSPTCVELKDHVRKLAKCQDEVLITGNTGTGKELVARAMIGDRKGAFVAANCAGLPENLIESELFGHMKGAFTGAESQKQGMFARAADGVMFLDEIGELPLSVQAKLLRAIQDKVIRKVGCNIEEEISCKFVCATHRNLKKMVKDGQFREDLYARISTFELHIPSLAERLEDVPLIIKSTKAGAEFWKAFEATGARVSDIDLSLNVRAIQRMIKRYTVLGKVMLS